ncbi:MAG: signal peptidase II [Verrucomicrobiota bacterium]|jgi:signal peptidase II
MNWTPNRRLGGIALAVFVLDQAAKWVVLRFLGPTQERVMINGFFKFVHWTNTGAAWSLFRDRNDLLAIVSLLALLGLFLWRHHFYIQTLSGQISLGLIFGGIAGNLFDRLHYHQVIDFLRFYLQRRSGAEIGFPAFNIADSAICVGVGLLLLISWKQESQGARSGGAKVAA